jgi:hypothetical protein
MKMEKVTKVEMFEAIKAQLVDEAQIAFIDNEIRMVKAKNARRSNKPSKAQVANAELGAVVVAKLEADKRYTASEVQKAVEDRVKTHVPKQNTDKGDFEMSRAEEILGLK